MTINVLKKNAVALLIGCLLACYPPLLYAQGIITIDHQTQRFVGAETSLDRAKYLNGHFVFNGPDTDFDAFKSTYNIAPSYTGSRQFWSPLGKVNNGQIPSNIPDNFNGVRQVTPGLVGTSRASKLMYDSNVDYSTVDVSVFSQQLAAYVAQSYKDEWNPMQEFIEPFNEPMVHASDFYPGGFNTAKNDSVISHISLFHKDLGQAVHAVPELANLKVMGYASAFPEFENNDFDLWNKRFKKFIDIAGADVDVFSVHLYDGSGINNTGGRRSGSNAEAILDLIEAYSFIELGTVKPLAVTEYGRLVLSQPGWTSGGTVSNYEPVENAQAVRSQIHMVMNFIERQDNIATTIPFSVGKSDPFVNQFSRAALFIKDSNGSYALTERKYFYEMWKDVKGDRVLINSTNLDVQTQAFVDGTQLYVVLNNLNDATQTVDLNLLDQQGLQNVDIKRLKVFSDKVPELVQTTENAAPANINLEYGETVVLTYTFANDVVFTNDIRSKKFYAHTYLTPIVANTELSFTFDNVDVGTNGLATLRLGIGRDQGSALIPTIKINGQAISIYQDIIRGYNQQNRTRFFGLLEIPVDVGMLNAGTNTVSVSFSDNGGHVSSAILQVQKATQAITLPEPPKYAAGDGSANDPYQISTPAHLIALANSPDDWTGNYFVLINDIDMAGQFFSPIGNQATPFTGDFNGGNYEISNLAITPPADKLDGTGLFGIALGINLYDLGIVNISINIPSGNYTRVGGLVGILNGASTVKGCYTAGGSITVNGGWTGGIVGTMFNGGPIRSIEDCYSSVTIQTNYGSGGIVGMTRGQYPIERVAFYGSISGGSAIVTVQNSPTNAQQNGLAPTNAFFNSATGATDANAVGLDATQLLDSNSYTTFDFSGTWEIDTLLGYAVLSKPPYGGGTGTQADPYLIKTPEDLLELSSSPDDWGPNTYFQLGNDLDMTGQSFTPIGNPGKPFAGTFNGDNFAISNLQVTATGINDGTGLFGQCSGSITDLGMRNILINSPGTNRCGAITGQLLGGTILRCYSEGGSINVGGNGWVGGIVGVIFNGNIATVEDCYSSTSITAGWGKGGVVGQTRDAHLINRVAYYGPSSNHPAIVNVLSNGGIPPTNAVYALASGASDPNGTGLSVAELLDAGNYPTFDFTNTWQIDQNLGYALLRSEPDTSKVIAVSVDTVINEGCATASDGILVLNASGTPTTFEYSIDGGLTWSSSGTFNNLPSGKYFAMSRDPLSPMLVSDSVVATILPGIALPTFSFRANQGSCVGDFDGSIKVTALSGTAPFSYRIDGGAFISGGGTYTFDNLDFATHLIEIQDDNGCISETREVLTSASLAPAFQVKALTDASDSIATDGSFQVFPSSGEAPFTYSLDNGQTYGSGATPFTFSNQAAGCYEIRIKDANGCESGNRTFCVNDLSGCPSRLDIARKFRKNASSQNTSTRNVCEEGIFIHDYVIRNLATDESMRIDWKVEEAIGRINAKATYNGTVPLDDAISGTQGPFTANGTYTLDLNAGMLGLENQATRSEYLSVSFTPVLIVDGEACYADPVTGLKAIVYPEPEILLDNAVQPGQTVRIFNGDSPEGSISVSSPVKMTERINKLTYDLHIPATTGISELATEINILDFGTDISNGTYDGLGAFAQAGITGLTNTTASPIIVSLTFTPKLVPRDSRAEVCIGVSQSIDVVVLPYTAEELLYQPRLGMSDDEFYATYPNPAVDKLNVLVPASLEKEHDLHLTDIRGELIRRVHLDSNQHIAKMDISFLPKGIYLVHVYAEGSRTAIFKVMKY